jgi:peptidyl-prolyl cis-trans isomerase C
MNKIQMAGLTAVLVAGAALGFASCANEKAEGEVVARVNGTPIYASSLDMELVRHEQVLLERGESAESMDPVRMGRFRAGALEKLIDSELLFQEALRTGHKVADSAVDEQMKTLSGQFENEEKFQEALNGLKIQRKDLWRDLQHSLAIQEFINTDIEPTVSVTDQEARAYYDDNPDLFTQPERIRARHILVQVPEEGGEAAATKARQTLEDLRRRALAGEDFAALAEQYSEGPSASAGGDLGYFGRGDMVAPFERAAFALKVGEISGIVITPFGYHLIQLVDRTPPVTLPFEQIASQLALYLRDQRVGEKVSDLARELRSKADISIAAHGE